MRHPRHWVNMHLGVGLGCALLLLPVLLPASSRAADLTLSSRTYLLYYQRDLPETGDRNFAPLYEYLSGDANDLGGAPLSFHFYGWGRADLGHDTGDDRLGGDLASAYLEYRLPTGNGQARLGRFFLTEGVAAETMDGIFVKGRTALGLGLSLFGGVPVERTITSTATGDSIYGGRVFYARPGTVEVGVTYLREKGDFQGDDRETVGGDFWLRPNLPLEVSGRLAYNVSTNALAQQRYVVRLTPYSRLDVAVGYENYKYKDLFQTALHPAFLGPAIDNNDEVHDYFIIVDFRVMPGLTLEGVGKSIRHDASDPGDATRAELGLRYAYNDRNDLVGVSAAVVSADRNENEYQEYRAFAMYSRGMLRCSLDALTQRYKEPIAGSSIKDAYQVVGSTGWQVLPYLKISGDLRYTRSPRFQEDYAGLVRAALDWGTTVGGQ